MLYVRTEQRPASKNPEHLFVTAHNRMTYTRWLPAVPAQMELVLDAEGRAQASEQEWLTLVAEHERDVAYRLLKQAVRWLPRDRADDLRRQWRETQPPTEGNDQ